MILLLKAYHVEELLKNFYRKLSESVVSFKALIVRIMYCCICNNMDV